jgi:lysophospholipase L1-like esterase
MRVPVARSGFQIRVAFRTGDGDATLHGATIAHAGEDGALASAPIPLLFGGAPGFSAGPRTRVVSDPVHFPIGFRDELYISFRVDGHLAAGAIDLFPDSWASADASPADMQLGDRSEHRAIALASVLVLGEPSRAFVAIGDSITEAFVDGRDDYRRNWPQVAEAIVGLPVVNAGVSGQGLWAALEYLDEEVLVLKDVTDCLVLLGTNDLGGVSDERLEGDLARLFDRLEPFCSVWAGTLPPKDRPEVTDEVRRQRKNINEWIRQEAEVAGVIDFEQVLAEPGHPDRWAAGLDEDGVHPSVSGQRVMGEEAARFINSEIVTR